MTYLLLAGLGLVVGGEAQSIRVTRVTSGVTAPTDIQRADDGSGRLFLVQQNGIIRVFRNGALQAQPFLDIRGKTTGIDERGLLGLAFPPGFAQKQRFYVDYTDLNGDTIIAQYRVSPNPDVADAASEVVVLRIGQPFPNHNGGQVRFGPDGYLYIAMGDGGSGGDPMNNGQRLDTLLAKILRIDVESQPGSVLIPPSNPFVATAGARPEVWAYGLRNPWRFSFDRATNDLWIADVGQEAYEEVDFQPASSRGGENYGWNRMEGLHCYLPNCSSAGLVPPVAEYTHADGCAVTGGFVYRGSAYPDLVGTYIYGDYCSGRIWGLQRQGAGWVNRQLLSSGLNITTFGEDEAGEIYVSDGAGGTIYHVESTSAACTFALTPPGSSIDWRGGNGLTFSIASAPACSWSTSTSANWLQAAPVSGTGSGAITYSVYPNYTSTSRTANIVAGGQNFTITQGGSSNTPDERFVRLLYFNLYGRQPSDNEVAFQVTEGVQKLGRAQVALNFFNGAEFAYGGRYIAGLYFGLLNRSPEYSGWLFQRNALSQNIVDPLGLARNFLNSPEFALQHPGGLDDPSFVRMLYRQALLREPSQVEVDYQMTYGIPAGRVILAYAFLTSQEFELKVWPQMSAFLLYSCLLQRDATSSELNQRTTQMQQGATFLQLIAELIASSEFNGLIQ